MPYTILITGLGALGTVFATLLKEAGHTVHALTRDKYYPSSLTVGHASPASGASTKRSLTAFTLPSILLRTSPLTSSFSP